MCFSKNLKKAEETITIAQEQIKSSIAISASFYAQTPLFPYNKVSIQRPSASVFRATHSPMMKRPSSKI